MFSSNSQDRKKYQNLRKVRITAVDNFQGEDNKIILLSLVRSNKTNNIGYLAFKNRICVALSRAKHGLYVIGNMTVLSKASKIWANINATLQEKQAIGRELELMCATHKVTRAVSSIKYFWLEFVLKFRYRFVFQVFEPSDFDELKYGGCQNPCNLRMHCGHLCTLSCHTNMIEHFSDCKCNI